MAPNHSFPVSPTSVADVPAEITMLRIDNVLVNGTFYNLEDTMDRLDWLADNYRTYDRFYTNLAIGTLTRIRNNRITLIDPFTNEYRAINDPIAFICIPWAMWWERHGVPTATDERQPNEYIRLWARFRREGGTNDVIDLEYSDDEGDDMATQASF